MVLRTPMTRETRLSSFSILSSNFPCKNLALPASEDVQLSLTHGPGLRGRVARTPERVNQRCLRRRTRDGRQPQHPWRERQDPRLQFFLMFMN